MDGEYVIEVHLDRKHDNYKTDRLVQLLVNGEPFATDHEQWVYALRDWVNSLGIPTKAHSVNGLERVLLEAGYRFGFLEQHYEYPNGRPPSFEEAIKTNFYDTQRVVRKYKVAPVDPVEDRYKTRHLIAAYGLEIARIAISDYNSDLDMARAIDEQCVQIRLLTQRYEGHGITQSGPGRPMPAQARTRHP